MNYHRESGQVQYRSKDGKETKVFDALEWPRQRAAGCPANGMQAQALAAMCSHVPNKGKQKARYYGFYSNVARGKRKKTDADDKIPCFLEAELTGKTFRRNWARLIQKIYHVDPLLCSKCSGFMKIISLIDDPEIIKKILNHLGLWGVKRKPPSCANGPPTEAWIIYDESSSPGADDYIIDADYPIETYL